MANFRELSEVMLFIWQWQKVFTFRTIQLVQAARFVSTRAFLLASQMASDLFGLIPPWTNQVLEVMTKSWNLVLQRLPAPIVAGFRKLNDLRDNVWGAAFDIAEKLAFAGQAVAQWLVTPLIEIVDRIRAALFRLSYIARTIAFTTSREIFDTETRTHDATGDVAEQIDELSSWLDHILDAGGYLQPRILLASAWVNMGALVALLVNGGILGTPKVLFAELLEKFPFPDGSTVLTDLTEGKMASEENIKAALDTFDRWVR